MYFGISRNGVGVGREGDFLDRPGNVDAVPEFVCTHTFLLMLQLLLFVVTAALRQPRTVLAFPLLPVRLFRRLGF